MPPAATAPATGLGRFAAALGDFAVLAALAVVPLYFNPQTERVFEPDKMAWLVLLALIAGWGLTVRAAEDWPARPVFRRWPPLAWAVVFAGAALAMGFLFSRVPQVSAWGIYRRAQGAMAYAAYLTVFAAVASGARDPAARARCVRLILAAAVPAALYALFQRFEIDSLEWNIYGTSPAERAFGPLGNPIFLGAYLIMVLPIALGRLLEALADLRRGAAGAAANAIGSAAVAGLSLAGLLASQSRGPLVGLIAGVGLFALLWAVRSHRRRLAWGLVGGGVAGLIVFGIAARAGALAGLGRLGELGSMGSRTAQERLLLWNAFGRLVADHPGRLLVGHGPETTAFVLPPYLPDALIRLAPVQVFDRAHNVLWDWWISAGLFGVAALLLLYVAAFHTGFRLLGIRPGRSPDEPLGDGSGDEAAGPTARRWWVRPGAMLAGAMLGGAMAGPVAVAATGHGVLAAPAAVLGVLAGAAAYAALCSRPVPAIGTLSDGRRRRGGGEPARSEAHLVVGLLAALGAHLAEGALGLPTATSELLFWVYLGMLAALSWPAPNGDSGPAADAGRADPWADGLADGLAIAAILFAPILLPAPARAWAAWPILLLPLAYWAAADLLSAPARPRHARAVARLFVAAGFGVLFIVLRLAEGGEILAFGLTLALASLAGAGALATARRGAGASAPWRWVPYASLAFLGALAAWWLLLRPELADWHVRAGQEAELSPDRAGAEAHYERARALWPAQGVYATYLTGALRQDMLDSERPEAERARTFERARLALAEAWARAPDSQYPQLLGVLFRDRGDLAIASGGAGQWWREAALYFEQSLALHPRNPATLREHGALLERLGQWAEARQAYADAFSLSGGDFEAAAGAMRAALAEGDVTGAAALLDRAWASDAAAMRGVTGAAVDAPLDLVRADQVRCMALARAGDEAGAARLLDEIAARAPNDAAVAGLREWLAGQMSP